MPVTSIANIHAKPSMRSVKSSPPAGSHAAATRNTWPVRDGVVAVQRDEQRRERDGAREPRFRVARVRGKQHRHDAAGERQREQHDQRRCTGGHRDRRVVPGADTIKADSRVGGNDEPVPSTFVARPRRGAAPHGHATSPRHDVRSLHRRFSSIRNARESPGSRAPSDRLRGERARRCGVGVPRAMLPRWRFACREAPRCHDQCDDEQRRRDGERDPHADGDGVRACRREVARRRCECEDRAHDGCAGDEAEIARQVEHAGNDAALVRQGHPS